MAAADDDQEGRDQEIWVDTDDDSDMVLVAGNAAEFAHQAVNAEFAHQAVLLDGACSTPEVIAKRIHDFVAPVGFIKFKPKKNADSIAYDYGVRVVKEGEPANAGTGQFKLGAYHACFS